jgi:hypothetical protein
MKSRISLSTALPLISIEKMALTTKFRDIGQSDDSTSSRPQVA